MKNKKIVKKGIWTFLMLAVLCLWMFPDTAYGSVEKRFSWNGFVYVEDFPKEDFVHTFPVILPAPLQTSAKSKTGGRLGEGLTK